MKVLCARPPEWLLSLKGVEPFESCIDIGGPVVLPWSEFANTEKCIDADDNDRATSLLALNSGRFANTDSALAWVPVGNAS